MYPSSLLNLATIHTENSMFCQQSLGMIQACVTVSQSCSFCTQSSVHSSANYIHCSIKLSICISLFTVIHNSLSKLISFVQLTFCMRVMFNLSGCQCNSNEFEGLIWFIQWRVFLLCSSSLLLLINVSDLFTLIHPFILTWYYLMIPNTYYNPLTPRTNYRLKYW